MSQNRRTARVLTWAILGCLLTALPGRAQLGSCPSVQSGTSAYTFSTRTVYNDSTVNTTQAASAYQVELKARMQGGGAYLYDQTFSVSYTDPTVQAAIAQAKTSLTSAGAASFIGPTQLSSSQSTSSSTTTGPWVVQSSATSSATTVYFGPQTLMVGANQSVTCAVAAGASDFDTLTTTTVTRQQTVTTTNTTLATQVYELDGIPAGPPPAPTPAPPSLFLALAGLGVAGLLAGARGYAGASRTSRFLAWAILGCLLAALPGWAQTGAGQTTYTASAAEIDTVNTTNVTQQVNTYQVELKARMQGSGTYLYDRTFTVPFTDPTVQTAIATARGVLTGAGAASFTGPTQLSSSQSTSSATGTVQNGRVIGQTFSVTTYYFGPMTITVGDHGTCQGYTTGNSDTPPTFTGCTGGTAWPIAAGGVNFDTLTATPVTVSQTVTTTNTTLTTQVYELDGVPAGSPPATPAPPSLFLALGGLGVAGVLAGARRYAGVCRTSRFLAWAVMGCLLAALPGRAQTGSCPTVPAGTSNSTYSTRTVYNDSTVNASQQVNTYQVELKARMQGGAYLYDQTFSVAYTDPTVQVAIAQARTSLTNAGAVSFTGPTQLSSSQSTSSSTNTGPWVVQSSTTSTATTQYIGPQTLMVGANQSTACTIAAGGTDFDTLTTTTVARQQTVTTTNTTLTTQVYELDGVPAGSPPATPAPPSLFLALAGLGLAGLLAIARRYASASRTNRVLAWAILGCLLTALPGRAQTGAGQTTFTVSFAEIDTVNTTNVTQQVNTYQVELKARIQGAATYLYDQTFTVPFTDPTVQTAIATAKGVLTGAGAASCAGPTQLSSSQSTSSGTSTGPRVPTGSTTSTTTTGYIGPMTITVGAHGICQSYTPGNSDTPPTFTGCSGGTVWPIAAGGVNYDTLVITNATFSQTVTTTNTTLTSQVYELDGIPAGPPPATPAPPSLSLALAGLGVAGLLAGARRYASASRTNRVLAWAILGCLLAALPSRAQTGPNETTATTSTAEIDTVNTTNVTQQVNTYQVELKARMQGAGTYLYDRTFTVPFTDPTVQTAIATARGVLTGAGAASFTGPTQLSSSQSTGSATSTVQNGRSVGQLVADSASYIGPQTITTGDHGICQSYMPGNVYQQVPPQLRGCSLSGTAWAIAAGGVDYDTLVVTPVTVNQTVTTTNTTLTTQVYELDGVPAGSPPAPTPAPPSLFLALAGLGVAGLLAGGRRYVGARRTSRILAWAILGCLLTALPGRAQIGSCPTVPAGTTNYTFSTRTVYSDSTLNTTQAASAYQVELKARMQGGAYLYDQTFSVAYTDPTVQAAIAQAKTSLTSAGAASFTGPTQLSSSQSRSSSTSTGPWVVQNSTTSAVSTAYVGPQTLMVGANQGIACAVAAGAVNVDTLTTTTVTRQQTVTTTNTTLTTQVYELDGVPAGSPPAPTPAPPSLFLALAGLGVAGLLGGVRRYAGANRTSRVRAWAILGCLLTALPGRAQTNAGQTTYTTSTAEIDTVNTTNVTQQVNTYQVELRARMQGSGTYLYDRTFTVPFTDPTVQTAIATAKGVLTGAGAASFTGPAQLSSSQSTSSATSTVQNGRVAGQLVAETSSYIGPQTITVGDHGICQSYTPGNLSQQVPPQLRGCSLSGTAWAIAAGGADDDTLIVTPVTVNQTVTTTNTTLTTQVYELDGVPASTSPAPTPAPPSLFLALAGLGVAGLLAVSRRYAGASRTSRVLVWAVLGGLMAAGVGRADTGPGQMTTTDSNAEIDTINTTSVTQQANTWQVELKARMQGSGAYLYDQMFTVPFIDPTVQAAIATAKSALTGAGAVSFTGPTQLSSTQSTGSSTNTVQNGRVAGQPAIETDDYIGPQTITVGDHGICRSFTPGVHNVTPPQLTGCSGGQTWVVAAGGENLDTLEVTPVTVNQTTTTTNTTLTRQVYELDGVPAGSPAPTPVPPSLLLGLTGLGVAGLSLAARRFAGASRTSRVLAWAVLGCLLTALPGRAQMGTGPGETTYTSATAAIDTVNTTRVTQQVNTYQVELKARMQGAGAWLYDQTFTVPFTDPTVQAAIATAKSALTGAGAVSFTGPTQLSSTQSTSSATNTVQNSKVAGQLVIETSDNIGPQTITTGDRGICQSYTPGNNSQDIRPQLTGCSLSGTVWPIAAGGEDYDTLGVTPVTVNQTTTTTNTTLTTQVYELDGVPAGSPPAPTPAPPSLFLTLGGLGLAGVLTLARKYLARPSPKGV